MTACVGIKNAYQDISLNFFEPFQGGSPAKRSQAANSYEDVRLINK